MFPSSLHPKHAALEMPDNKAASLYVLIWLMYIIVYPQFIWGFISSNPESQGTKDSPVDKTIGVGEKSSP